MKSITGKIILLLAFCTTAVSFSPKPGGEGFEILLNNKVILQKYGNNMDKVQTLQLRAASSGDMLTVRYYHCGRIGKNRTITFKDGNNKIIKEFNFSDVNSSFAPMTLQVKDILSLQSGNSILKLFYSSSELPGGRMLASINKGIAGTAKL